MERWRSSVVELDREVYADAKKEFSLSAMTGFGADGDEVQQARDFEEVRGAFDSNPYVSSILKHIEDKSALGQELLDRLATLL